MWNFSSALWHNNLVSSIISLLINHIFSRTDSGVHALNSTVHVDLERCGGYPYVPRDITKTLNRMFFQNNMHIRILQTRIVSDNFHCRYNAKSRTYLYRFAVRKIKNSENISISNGNFLNYVPIEEIDRCLFIQ